MNVVLNLRQRLAQNEFKKEYWLRNTRKASRSIYSFTANQSRRLMRIVGRLRKISFGVKGKLKDIDEYDMHPEKPYRQLIVNDEEDNLIVGGYRYQPWKEAPRDERGNPDLSTMHYFDFSERFMTDYGPYIIELGRSFVVPKYQARNNNKSIFSLDNLWDGLGALINRHPDMRYFFGKMTLYRKENEHSKAIIYSWLDRRFGDKEGLVTPKKELAVKERDRERLEEILKDVDDNVNKEIATLNKYFKEEYGEQIPPLFSSYAKLSPTMKYCGTATNKQLGDVEEAAILIKIQDIDPKMLERYTTVEHATTGKA